MNDFEIYRQEKFIPYINKIKTFLKSVSDVTSLEKTADFYMSLEYEMPAYQGDFEKLNEKELKTNSFLCELDNICEMVEPFSDCKKENEMLFCLMKKYNYL